MKTFYTEQDIEHLWSSGVTTLTVGDAVVLTALAQERAQALGLTLVEGSVKGSQAIPSSSSDIVARVKARVVARLGTTQYNDLLDEIIPKVLARATAAPPSASASTAKNDSY